MTPPLPNSPVPSPPGEPEELLGRTRAIVYRGWVNSLRLHLPFAGSPGFLTLTSRRLVFIKGLFGGQFEEPQGLDQELARRKGFQVPLGEVVEVTSKWIPSLAIGGSEVRFAIRVARPWGTEAFTFVVTSFWETIDDMASWVSRVKAAGVGKTQEPVQVS